jgi:FixJ family two-component response regulator
MGAVDFLPKPFTPAELRAAVARALAIKAQAAGTKG